MTRETMAEGWHESAWLALWMGSVQGYQGDSDAANSSVDLTVNVNMIEKLVLGGTGTGDLPILSPTL